uniref:Subtilisin inhibitor 1 n=1 Tax=Aegilops tauschii subsp. strangulata TaxID=200361 RepID=A0A453M932_AEGTS
CEQAMEAGGATAGVGAEKNSWPEVVGLSSEEAKKKIIQHKPDASVHVVPADSFVTMDYNTGRVRVFVDSNDKVTKAPRIG